MKEVIEKGTLYIVATPIGNLGDLTDRAREVLRAVDLIAAEDTRVTRKLLSLCDIHTPTESFHRHNEQQKIDKFIQLLREESSVALVSDAGTPTISDPGYILVRAVREAGLAVRSIPGPCAAIVALSLSGLATDRFCFEGYLSASPQKRRKKLRTLVDEQRTLIFYEAPHRIKKALIDCEAIFGSERGCFVGRELTKKFEEHVAGTTAAVRISIEQKDPRGEYVLILAGQEDTSE